MPLPVVASGIEKLPTGGVSFFDWPIACTAVVKRMPGWARFGLRFIPRRGLLALWLARIARGNAQDLARRFIAGSNLQEALVAVEHLRRKQLTFTVDLLGEATITEKEAQKSQDDYLALIAGLNRC